MIDYELVNSLNSNDFIYFLHGWGGSKESFYFAKEYFDANLVFVSFSGFGNSPPPTKPYSLEDYAKELKEVVDKISYNKKIKIVCHSFGCRVMAVFNRMYPSIIDKILIVDGAGVKPRRGMKYYHRIYRYKKLKMKVQKGKEDPSVLDKFGSSDYKILSSVMKQTFINVVNFNSKRDFKNIKVKTLIFWGKNDKETPLYMAKKINKWIKGSSLKIVNGGHFSYIESPSAFLKIINDFLIS